MGLRREAQAALAAIGVRPRKRWGQHFLCDAAVIERILVAANLGAESAVLEIGPGLGALTDRLAARACSLHLVEIDPLLAERLAARYAALPHVRLTVGDALEVPLDLLSPSGEMIVLGNLPYNISTPLIFRLLEFRHRLPRAVLMVQREVARRLAARPGGKEYGGASVIVQAFAEVEVKFTVGRGNFWPVPQVDSAIIELRWGTTPRVPMGDPTWFREVVHAAFGRRRKMLHNALATLGLPPQRLAEGFAEASIDPAARAETLEVASFARLARVLEN